MRTQPVPNHAMELTRPAELRLGSIVRLWRNEGSAAERR